MKEIYKSEIHGWNESAEQVIIYPLADDEEFWLLDAMSHDDRCEYFDLYEENDVIPGGIFHTYSFCLSSNFMIIIKTIAYNV